MKTEAAPFLILNFGIEQPLDVSVPPGLLATALQLMHVGCGGAKLPGGRMIRMLGATTNSLAFFSFAEDCCLSELFVAYGPEAGFDAWDFVTRRFETAVAKGVAESCGLKRCSKPLRVPWAAAYLTMPARFLQSEELAAIGAIQVGLVRRLLQGQRPPPLDASRN